MTDPSKRSISTSVSGVGRRNLKIAAILEGKNDSEFIRDATAADAARIIGKYSRASASQDDKDALRAAIKRVDGKTKPVE